MVENSSSNSYAKTNSLLFDTLERGIKQEQANIELLTKKEKNIKSIITEEEKKNSKNNRESLSTSFFKNLGLLGIKLKILLVNFITESSRFYHTPIGMSRIFPAGFVPLLDLLLFS